MLGEGIGSRYRRAFRVAIPGLATLLLVNAAIVAASTWSRQKQEAFGATWAHIDALGHLPIEEAAGRGYAFYTTRRLEHLNPELPALTECETGIVMPTSYFKDVGFCLPLRTRGFDELLAAHEADEENSVLLVTTVENAFHGRDQRLARLLSRLGLAAEDAPRRGGFLGITGAAEDPQGRFLGDGMGEGMGEGTIEASYPRIALGDCRFDLRAGASIEADGTGGLWLENLQLDIGAPGISIARFTPGRIDVYLFDPRALRQAPSLEISITTPSDCYGP